MDDVVRPAPPSEVPVACPLGPDDGQARLRRWQLLNESATPSPQVLAGTLQVRYQPGPGVQEELTDLAAAEQTCCSFVSVGHRQRRAARPAGLSAGQRARRRCAHRGHVRGR